MGFDAPATSAAQRSSSRNNNVRQGAGGTGRGLAGTGSQLDADLLTACLLCLFGRLADQQGRVHAAVRYCWIEHELVSSLGYLDSAAAIVSSSQQRIIECAGGAKPSKREILRLNSRELISSYLNIPQFYI